MHSLLAFVVAPLLISAHTPSVTTPSLLSGARRVPVRSIIREAQKVAPTPRTLVRNAVPLQSRRAKRQNARLYRQRIVRPVLPKTPTPVSTPLQSTPNQTYIPTYPLPSLNATSHILVLGEKAPVVATVKVTPQDEPVYIRRVTITLSAEVPSVTSFEVMDEFGFVLGIASLDIVASAGRDIFTLDIPQAKSYFLGEQETVIFAVRPILKEEDAGGASGEDLEVSSITFLATGEWTSKDNLVSTSGTDFQAHETANGILMTIARNGGEKGTFTPGAQKKIGSFSFTARKNRDGQPALTALTFSLSTPTEVTVSNVLLRGNDSETTHSCLIASNVITCSSIPTLIGSLSSPRTLTLFADIAVTSHPNPFLQVTLNTPGRPGTAGDITWTDGDTSFTWVPFNYPIVEGTVWE